MHAIHNGSEDESKKTKKNQTITISKALFTNGLLGERANEPFEGS